MVGYPEVDPEFIRAVGSFVKDSIAKVRPGKQTIEIQSGDDAFQLLEPVLAKIADAIAVQNKLFTQMLETQETMCAALEARQKKRRVRIKNADGTFDEIEEM